MFPKNALQDPFLLQKFALRKYPQICWKFEGEEVTGPPLKCISYCNTVPEATRLNQKPLEDNSGEPGRRQPTIRKRRNHKHGSAYAMS